MLSKPKPPGAPKEALRPPIVPPKPGRAARQRRPPSPPTVNEADHQPTTPPPTTDRPPTPQPTSTTQKEESRDNPTSAQGGGDGGRLGRRLGPDHMLSKPKPPGPPRRRCGLLSCHPSPVAPLGRGDPHRPRPSTKPTTNQQPTDHPRPNPPPQPKKGESRDHPTSAQGGGDGGRRGRRLGPDHMLSKPKPTGAPKEALRPPIVPPKPRSRRSAEATPIAPDRQRSRPPTNNRPTTHAPTHLHNPKRRVARPNLRAGRGRWGSPRPTFGARPHALEAKAPWGPQGGAAASYRAPQAPVAPLGRGDPHRPRPSTKPTTNQQSTA